MKLVLKKKRVKNEIFRKEYKTFHNIYNSKEKGFFISRISKSKRHAFNLKYMFCYTEKKTFCVEKKRIK